MAVTTLLAYGNAASMGMDNIWFILDQQSHNPKQMLQYNGNYRYRIERLHICMAAWETKLQPGSLQRCPVILVRCPDVSEIRIVLSDHILCACGIYVAEESVGVQTRAFIKNTQSYRE